MFFILLSMFLNTDATPMQCDPSYPSICIEINAPDVDCKDLTERGFIVLPPDPHKLDKNQDGVGCEN